MIYTTKFTLTPENHHHLILLCGPNNQNISFIEKEMSVKIKQRGTKFRVIADKADKAQVVRELIEKLYICCQKRQYLDLNDIHVYINKNEAKIVEGNQKLVTPRTKNQQAYVDSIYNHTITFGIGPAGTGKTLLATACAIDLLKKDKINKIIISRPVVESGEQLGFLPGDLQQKIHPYMVPLFDCLSELIGPHKLSQLLDNGTIEIAPLAYMRGRSLKNACIILDEAQNSTPAQMKMLLTRLADNSLMIINGDVQQIDLQNKQSGLIDATKRLQKVDGIETINLTAEDVMRHPLISKIIKAYEK